MDQKSNSIPLFNGKPVEGGCGEVPAIVVVPYSLKPPYPVNSGDAITQNLLANNTTSPAFPQVRDPKVWLITIYFHVLSIPVYDQFGELLIPIYDGQPVDERFSDKNVRFNINRRMKDGHYLDPVGIFGFGAAREIVDKDSPRANEWPTSSERKSMPNPPANRDIQDIFVYVAGHLIRSRKDGETPAVTNRSVVGTAPDQITITWPAPPNS